MRPMLIKKRPPPFAGRKYASSGLISNSRAVMWPMFINE
jgi:hypothetical protein